MFDTTSVNTGTKQGIVGNLELSMDKKLLQLACRHHIFELLACACCTVVYGTDGKSTCPSEPVFEVLKKEWESIDKSSRENYRTVIKRCSREISSRVSSTIQYLESWLENNNKSCLRGDYKEMVVLALLFLKESSSETVSIMSPGACHHARWMSRVIYTLKIAIFQRQLQNVFDLELIEKITSLALFLCLFYSKSWLCAASRTDAPKMDLMLIKDLQKVINIPEKYPKYFGEFADKVQTKFADHLWYLSERLVPLCLFSDLTTVQEKQSVRQALLKFQGMDTSRNMLMPCFSLSASSKYQLKDFVGPDSWTFFQLLSKSSSQTQGCRSNSQFIIEHSSSWPNNPSYNLVRERVERLTVVNDPAERALALLTEFHSKNAPQDEEQRQYLLKVVKELRERQGNAASGVERSTKKTMSCFEFDCL